MIKFFMKKKKAIFKCWKHIYWLKALETLLLLKGYLYQLVYKKQDEKVIIISFLKNTIKVYNTLI